MPKKLLTDEQLPAATSKAALTFVDAAPGSGKTFMSVERFGWLRYHHLADDPRAVAGVSYARSASADCWASSGAAVLVKSFVLNADGRNPDGQLFDTDSLKVGTYRLVFDVAGYFKALGVALPEPNFLNLVTIDFGVANTSQHYHVPLLVSPWSYSTYRGS